MKMSTSVKGSVPAFAVDIFFCDPKEPLELFSRSEIDAEGERN